MAKTYGYGIQAFTSGLKGGFNIGMQMFELEQEKKARKDLKEAQEKTKELFNKFITDNKLKIDDFENLPMSERYSINMAMYNFSKEYGDLYRQANDALDKKDFEALEQINELINTKIDKDLEVGIKYGETIAPEYFRDPMATKPFTPEQLKGFKTGAFYKESPAGVQEKIAPSVAGKLGLDLKFQPEKAKIADYSSAINYLLKFKNAPPDTFGRIKAGYQKQFPKIDMAEITQEALKGIDTATKKYYTSAKEAMANSPDFEGLTKQPVQIELNKWKIDYMKKTVPTPTPKGEITAGEKRSWDMASSVLFGSSDILSGIQKPGIISTLISNKLNMGQPLTEEEKAEVRNSYNAIKDTLPNEIKNIVESQLKRYGISLEALKPKPLPEPEPEKKGTIEKLKDWWKGGETTTPKTGEIPSIKVPTEGKEALIPMMTNKELYEALKGLDPSDPIYKSLYDEAVKRGLITK